MKGTNHALEDMLRGQRLARRANQRSHLTLIDKVALAYRTTTLIRTMKKSSWKTTLGGLLIAAGQAAPSILPAAWHWLGGTLTGIGGIVLGMAARDNNVTSQEAGAK